MTVEREDMTMVRLTVAAREGLRQIARARGQTLQGALSEIVRRELRRVDERRRRGEAEGEHG